MSIPQTATQCDTPAPGSLVPLQLQQGTVVADGSRPVLQGLTELAEVTASSRGQLVLGLTSPGQTAMFDVALGQVCFQEIHSDASLIVGLFEDFWHLG